MVPPPAFRDRGNATLEAGGPGSVLVRGPAQQRFATAIARAQLEAVNFALVALEAEGDQTAVALASLSSYPSGDAVRD
eukprot:11198341-Lingulodinium_polyedra.AAC.1